MKTLRMLHSSGHSMIALILSRFAEIPCEETTFKKMTWSLRKVHFLGFAYKLSFLKTTHLREIVQMLLRRFVINENVIKIYDYKLSDKGS